MEGQYLLYDQAQLDWQNLSLAGVEVILRSHSGEVGWIHRHRFIPISEKTGLILPEEQIDFRASLGAISAVVRRRANSSYYTSESVGQSAQPSDFNR
ncbi:hypothetical protein [Microcoleus vaginatus]|uniref:hypothetical protein n=1 Tax=Microcoleus vaginatus TaxID=119532 RepID=UPI001F61D9A8|nr:hypothetical protein D0A37_07905 [Microcoleus vaginatus HSN003]